MMLKRKTLFKKYLFTIMTILIFSFLILGLLLWVSISNYWENDKRELLLKNASGISYLVEQNSTIIDNDKVYINNESIMQSFIETFSNNINADIFVTDLKGQMIFRSNSGEYKQSYHQVPQEIIKRVQEEGKLSETGTLGQVYSKKCFFVGVPVLVEGRTVAVVFTAIDSQYLNAFRGDIFTILLWAMIVAMILSLIAIGVLSYTIVKPMRQVANAAKALGSGDFSQRVPVTSEDEIGQLSLAFNNMADSLSRSEEMNRSFIANISHELKTPMTTISGFVDGILDGTINSEQQEHYLQIVSGEVKRLSRLVKTMLNLSRIDSGTVKLRMNTFDLLSIVVNVLVSFEDRINEKKISITGLENSESVFVYGDMDMIYQAVYNLIENSIKFANENGYIDIKTKRRDDKAIFTIRNSGPGISPAEIGRIFDRFYKTDRSRSRDKNGMGLGLYIVKQILHLHGGDISVRSTPNQYTEFSFFVPIRKEDAC